MSHKRSRSEDAPTPSGPTAAAKEKQFLHDQRAFVQSCIDFETNVKVNPPHDAAAAGSTYADVVLLVANTKAQTAAEIVATLKQTASADDDGALLAALLASSEPAVADLVAAAVAGSAGGKAAGSASTRLAHASHFVQVTAVVLPAVASRGNCPYRPDAAVGPLREAVKAVRANSKVHAQAARAVLEIVVLAPAAAALPVTVAVARAMPNRFTAKGGNGHSGAYADPQLTPQRFAAHVHLRGVAAAAAARLAAVAQGVQLAQRLIDAPPSVLNTVSYAAVIAGLAERRGCRVEVIKGEDLKEKGYGGMYAVGKGAEYPPHLITLLYGDAERQKKHIAAATADAAPRRHIALVGKGIVYDCGGLALKPAAAMSNMKTDMGGSAAVLNAFLALVDFEAQSKHALPGVGELSCTLCVAENAIGSRAYHNDDVVLLKSGKSIEVMNTDAEGRIVLADGVYHATGELAFVPDVLVDMATLTGAQGVACGLRHAGVYSNQAEAEAALLAAGRRSGDTCWPVLYCPEYHAPNYASPCADLRNINGGKPDASVSLGGYFVEANLAPRFAGALLHVDLAFPSFDAVGATGFGVALAAAYLQGDL